VDVLPFDGEKLLIYVCSGYNYDSTSIPPPFDCLPEVIEDTVT